MAEHTEISQVEGLVYGGEPQTLIGGKAFDVKTVLLRVLPSLIAIVTELITTGKISTKGKDSAALRAVLNLLDAVRDELAKILGIED